MATDHIPRMRYREGSAQVFHALIAIQTGLSGGITRSCEGIQYRNSAPNLQKASQNLGLIELPFAFPGRMQRYGNQGIDLLTLDSLVFQPGGHPVRQDVPQVELPLVFETMDKFPNDPASAVGGYRAVEVEMASFAASAGEFTQKLTIEWL